MDEAFALLDADAAQTFLKGLSAEARRKGLACFRSGRVLKVEQDVAGLEYSAQVRDGDLHSVELVYDEGEGIWEGYCSCPQDLNCEHVFAAMSAVLAEHRAAAVRNLSSGWGETLAKGGVQKGKPSAPGGDLTRRLIEALGRPLDKQETQFVRGVQEIYRRCSLTRQVTLWDFEAMGLNLDHSRWNGHQLWPSFPSNEHDFWLYVANAAQANGVELPSFMSPITDLTAVQERLARWKRSRDIETWKQSLGNFHLYQQSALPVTPGEADMRLVVGPQDLRLQWRRPGESDFAWMRQTHLRQFRDEFESGRVSLPAEAMVLWQLLSGPFNYRFSVEFGYSNPETRRVLRRLLTTSALDSRIVNAGGQPLPRSNQPLRWELIAATGEDGDYLLRLVQADGRPIPPLCCVLDGQPTLYVTMEAVFAGPARVEHLLDPSRENHIPAPAIERASGVMFLQALGLDMPPRISQRLRLVPYQIVIRCELKPAWRMIDTEECVFKVLAETPYGHQQTWTGYNWVHTGKQEAQRKPDGPNEITVFDSASLRRVPTLLEPLRLKPCDYDNMALAMRVTKKFPEIFGPWLKTIPPDIQVYLGGDLASFVNSDIAGRVKLDVSEVDIDWFDLRVVLNVSDTTLSSEEINLLLAAKGGYVRLKGKGWRRLQFDLSEEENERLARLGLNPRELSDEPQRLHALQLADEAAKKFLPAAQVEQIERRASEIKARVAPPLPGGITAQLRPYQMEGFHFLAYLAANRFGGILADDMGLGKTLQTLAWLVWLKDQAAPTHSNAPGSAGPAGAPDPSEPAAPSENGHVQSPPPQLAGETSALPGEPVPSKPSLVICPKSVMDNWQAEAARFTPGFRVRRWPASELGNFHKDLPSADLHVLNYSQARMLGESLVPIQWQAVILDEGQYIKNPNSQTAQVARALRAEHRLVLSGTPIENRLLDLWSLMAFTMPGVLSSRHQFAKLYDAKGDPFARRRLAARVRPFILRRTKSQVAKDLPDRIEEDLFCEIEGEQQTLYRAELKRAQQLLLGIKTQKELAKQQFHFLVSLLRLRQICCHPKLVKPDSTAPSAKSEALIEQLEPLMEEGYKVLVFSQFVEMLDLLRPELEQRKWPLFYLAGDTENRGQLVEKFQSAPGAAVFLISLKAGGFGLNLTAASYVVLFDPWWNPAVENQAIDRTHRIGQLNKVIAYRLLIKNSIEEKIRELQRQKKALAEDVLGEEKFSQSLSLEDLRFLFAD